VNWLDPSDDGAAASTSYVPKRSLLTISILFTSSSSSCVSSKCRSGSDVFFSCSCCSVCSSEQLRRARASFTVTVESPEVNGGG
ncbi:hypothetical protein PFISCL1PPCAC_283, partial [Pristionchus fissidentatus]